MNVANALLDNNTAVFNQKKCTDLFSTELFFLKRDTPAELICNDLVNLLFIESGTVLLDSSDGQFILQTGNVFLAEDKCYKLKNLNVEQDSVVLSVGLTQGMLSRFKQRYEDSVVQVFEQHLSTLRAKKGRSTPYIFEGCDLTRMAITTFRKFGEQPDFGLYSLKLEELLLLQMRLDNGYFLMQKMHNCCDPIKERFRHFVQENVLNDWSLSSFAKHAKMSLSSFKVMFKQVFCDTSPKSWINEKRLQHADKQLRTTNKRIIDIAMESGFSSQSYFTQSYKARFNRSPSEVRHRR